jgi:Vitamin K-dependent gamma-carboxylase
MSPPTRSKLIEYWQRYWFAPDTAEQLALVRVVTYGLLFAIYLPLDDRGWTQVSPVFWMPISAFHLLSGPPRNAVLIGALQVVWKTSLLTSAIGFVSRLSMVTAAALGFFLLGLPNCFGKIHHLDGFPVLLLFILALSCCADALSVDRTLRRWREMRSSPEARSAVSLQYRWPVRLAQTLFLLVFFAAGCAKLRNGGLAWMTATNMRSIWLAELFTHTPPTQLGSFLAQSAWLSQFAAVATVIVELSALPALFFRRLRVPILVGLLGLQTLIALMLGVYFTPHLVGYALFMPWERMRRPIKAE